jgi:Family of unknown function (DUF6134)
MQMRFRYFLFLGLFSSPCLNAQTWDFDVSMDGKIIGTHQFSLSKQENNKQILKSEAKFNVKFLSFNVFEYHHQADELWENDCLKSLEAKTKENSKLTVIKGYQDKPTFKVNVKPLDLETECMMTFAYWNPKILQQKKLLNPQTGEYLPTNITYIGKDTIMVKGEAVKADQYKIDTSKFKINIWYGSEGAWLALQSLTPDGRIDYALK